MDKRINVNIIVLIACTIMNATCYMSLLQQTYPYKPFTVDQLQCIKNEGYLDQAYQSIYYSQTGEGPAKWHTYTPLNVLHNAGSTVNLLTNFYWGRYCTSPQKLAQDLLIQIENQIQLKFIKTLWISVTFDSKNEDCPINLCDYLQIFTETIKNKSSIEIGIHSGKNWWENVLKLNQCSQLSKYPLAWLQQPYYPFQPFGGWTTYQLKFQLVYMTLYNCNFYWFKYLVWKNNQLRQE